MKRTLLIIALVSIATCQVISKSNSCTCAQLLTQADCGRNSSCSWNLTKLACETPTNTGTGTVTKNYGKSLYCEGLIQTDCLGKNECAWVDNKCTFFTSCTPFEKTSKDECQAISKRCITDGQICVEIDLCSTYLTSTSCQQSKTKIYCTWDETTKKCSDVTECSQLPTSLTKDSECRLYLKNECTAKNGGGCVESGTNCEDQTAEVGCVKNKARTADCFWGDNKCLEKKCDYALTSIKTHADCQNFSDKCTGKDGGGCVDIKTCADGKIKEGCVIDSQKNQCYWSATENKCKDKVCSSAPSTFKTNIDCQKTFQTKCITNGAGCVEDSACSSSTVQDQCAINRYNDRQCTWNGTCKEKTCDNAGAEQSGHESCTKYSTACTGKANNATGCQNRICENAPTTINSNDLCEAYLPKKNCITKKDGGCITNAACSAILIKEACVKNINGNLCYWDSVANACLDKTCATLPARFNTHSGCNGEITSCTVNSSGSCVDLLCENIIDKDNCVVDKDKNECIYYGSCYQKQCSAAPQTYTTHSDCQDYLGSCTLSNTKKGCMDLPITCSALIKENCELKANKSKCGWTGSACVDYICTTAPTRSDADYTVSLCESYKPNSNCVPNANKTGCIELVAACDSRKIKEQCDVAGTNTNGNKTCLWDSTNEKCYEKTCANATHEGNDNSVTVSSDQVSHNDCQGWLTDKDGNPLCIVGTSNKDCAVYPTSCTGLGENSCKTDVLKIANTNSQQYQNCYWNANTKKCVDGNVCANIDKTNHNDCSSVSNKKCTVNSDGNKCVDRTACSQYSKKVQCNKDKNDATCKWDGANDDTNKCIDLPCLDNADDSKSYDVHSECTTKSNQCTLTNLPCGIKKSTCSDYGNQAACLGGKLGDKAQCSWDASANSNAGACVDVLEANFDCTKVKGTNLTGGYCNSLKNTCSVNSTGNACIVASDKCGDYDSSTKCKWSKNEGDCFWKTTCQAVSILKCSDLPGTNDAECRTQKSNCIFGGSGKCKPDCASYTGTLTIDLCQNFDAECAVKNDGSACYYIDKACTALPTTTCTKGTDGYCYVSSGACVKTAVTSANCASITTASNGAAKLTGKYCAGISANACTALVDGSACDAIEETCAAYVDAKLAKCYYSKEGLCILETTCKKYVFGTSGCVFKTGGGSLDHTENLCKQFSSTCTVADIAANGCKAASVAALVCGNFKGTYNFQNCFHYSNTCSVNKAGTACITKQDDCDSYSDEASCAYAVIEGPCTWSGTKCVQKDCNNVSLTATELTSLSADICSAKQSNCTVRTGGCQKRTACTSYTKEAQCYKNLSDSDCIWNKDTKKCGDKTCSNADTSNNTHEKCQAVALNCTVKLGDDGTTLAGCTTLSASCDYKVKEQCYLNSANKSCEWSLAESPNKCVEKSCTSADPATYTDFTKCQSYLDDKSCTLASKKGDDGNYTDGGCMLLALCSEYNTQAQCKKSKLKNNAGNLQDCYWNDTTKKCADPACTQADDSYTTHEACVAYGIIASLKCTVDIDDKGCVPLPDNCEGMSKGQCQDVDSNNVKCIWLETSGNGSCAARTCENAVSPGSASDCLKHLSYCTMIDSPIKCKTKTCEDYNLTDDTSCAALFNKSSKCTTNGKFCVYRGSCAQALSQKGCTKDKDGYDCDWIVPTVATQSAYCVKKSCSTAPKEYTTETQCLQYYTPLNNAPTCTTQQGGGCIQRSTCSNAKVQAACTTDQSGNTCAWDSDTTTCRIQECKDINGTTHAACQNTSDKNLKNKCTAGKGGKCALIQKCASTTVEAACVVGSDGPCIWLPDYVNTDSSKGACFPYESCRSLDFSSDSQCKLISDKCTTDSKECIGITSCAKTNVNGGCKTGTDGDCITTLQSAGSSNQVCTKYVSCASALFNTHSQCNAANQKCTTDGTTCVELGTCESYKVEDACRYNKDGPQQNANKQITSTGVCLWDKTSTKCKDQTCADLQGTTHNLCSSQLSTCTTDGTTCITKDSCTKYTTSNTLCTSAQGTEGLCQWVEGTNGAAGTCRVKTCDDIVGGTTTTACGIVNNCTTDGTKCITRVTCDKFTTKAGCNAKGTDGICVWTETTTGTTTTGKCSLMSSCSAAAKDQNACQQASDRCKWTAASGTVASSCADYTCESYSAQTGKCSYFPAWDTNKLNICKLVSNKCTAADPKTLLESECYTLSAYMYSWNSKSSACAQCGSVISNPNNSTNPNNSENNSNGSSSTDSGYVLGVAVLLGYLMY